MTENIDSKPYIGTRWVNGFLKLSKKNYLDHYFDKSENYNQVINVTRGKIYQIIKVIGYGDVEDIVFINDIGEEQQLADFFFEEVTLGELNEKDNLISPQEKQNNKPKKLCLDRKR